eukprot:scaffold722_cov255-Prasinococcus_capsulatus_cf.AAC.4
MPLPQQRACRPWQASTSGSRCWHGCDTLKLTRFDGVRRSYGCHLSLNALSAMCVYVGTACSSEVVARGIGRPSF